MKKNVKHPWEIPGFLLHSILEALASGLFHRLSKIEGNLQDLEDEIFDEQTKSAKAKEVNLLRREIASLRRIAMPLRSRIYEITNEIQKFSKEDIISYYNDVDDHVDKIIETLAEAKETIEIYKDVYYMLGTEKANKILSILTLSIPIAVISSFYGMNINAWKDRSTIYIFRPIYKYDRSHNNLLNSYFTDVLVFPPRRLDEFRLLTYEKRKQPRNNSFTKTFPMTVCSIIAVQSLSTLQYRTMSSCLHFQYIL